MSEMPNRITFSLKKRFKKYNTQIVDNEVTLQAVFNAYEGKCHECGIDVEYIHPPEPHSASIEHIVPLSKGGSHTWDNVELLCHSCNVRRNHKDEGSKVLHIKKLKIFGYTINITKGN